jgi:hypothetical protein
MDPRIRRIDVGMFQEGVPVKVDPGGRPSKSLFGHLEVFQTIVKEMERVSLFFLGTGPETVLGMDTEDEVLDDLIGNRRGFHMVFTKEVPTIDPRHVVYKIHLIQNHLGVFLRSIGEHIEFP